MAELAVGSLPDVVDEVLGQEPQSLLAAIEASAKYGGILAGRA